MSSRYVNGEMERSEATVAPACAADDSRLEQLTAARNADRIWRSGRKAELERLINRSLGLMMLLVCAATGIAQWGLRLLGTPRATRSTFSWYGFFWDLCDVFVPPVVGWFVGSAFGKQLRPLVAEKKAYDDAPDDPVVWSTGLVIHPPTRETPQHPVPPAESSERTVVWSTGMVISLSEGPEAPACSSSNSTARPS